MIRQAKIHGIAFKTDWQSKIRLPENGGGEVYNRGLLDATKIASGLPETRKLAAARSAKPRVHRSVLKKWQADHSYRPKQFKNGLNGFLIVE